MGRSAYLTARCPTGCEAWLHPYALDQHVDGRCQGHLWVDDLPDTAVIPASYTDLILATLDEALRRTPRTKRGDAAGLRLAGRCRGRRGCEHRPNVEPSRLRARCQGSKPSQEPSTRRVLREPREILARSAA